MPIFSVNEAIELLDGLAGKDIKIRGLLSFEFENVSLNHVPLFERQEGYGSSLWLSIGTGSLAFDERACEALNGKVVVVEGTLYGPKPKFGGCGHLSLWPGEIVARTLGRDQAR